MPYNNDHVKIVFIKYARALQQQTDLLASLSFLLWAYKEIPKWSGGKIYFVNNICKVIRFYVNISKERSRPEKIKFNIYSKWLYWVIGCVNGGKGSEIIATDYLNRSGHQNRVVNVYTRINVVSATVDSEQASKQEEEEVFPDMTIMLLFDLLLSSRLASRTLYDVIKGIYDTVCTHSHDNCI